MGHRPGKEAVTAWTHLVRVPTQLLERIGAALNAAGLPPLAWYDVLLELERDEERGLRQFEIAGRTLLTKHNLSRLLDRLEREKLVRRLACPEDRRGNVVRITARGKALLAKMWPVYGAAIRTHLESPLTASEITSLNSVLGKLRRSGETSDAGG